MTGTIRYCETPDGARLAYAVTGKGSPIIRTSHWLTHIGHDLESPVWRHVILGLSHRHTLVRYDARGEGLSQGKPAEISFDGWVTDLETVVDDAGFPRFALFGASQGAATAIAYAVRHPERVSHLILYGGFARGMTHWTPAESKGQDFELACELIRQGWGADHEAHRQWFTSLLVPSGTAEQSHWFNKLQRVSATAEIAQKHMVASGHIDVSELLPRVTTPTLVLHSRDDAATPFSFGQELAARIPGARFVPLEGADHLFLAGTPAHRAFQAAIADFLGDRPHRGRLPGVGSMHERLDEAVRAIEQNWLMKAAALLAAATGLILAGVEFWKLAAGTR